MAQKTPMPYPGRFDAPTPSRALRAGDAVIATFDPTRVGTIRRFRTAVDVVVAWADGLVGETPASYLRLAAEV